MRTQSRQRRSLKQAGFTLIELIIVIVIIGIMAAVAIPKFSDLTNEAKRAAAKSTAAELGTAAAVSVAKNTVPANCTGYNHTDFLQSVLDSKYSITSQAISATAPTTCVLKHSDLTETTDEFKFVVPR